MYGMISKPTEYCNIPIHALIDIAHACWRMRIYCKTYLNLTIFINISCEKQRQNILLNIYFSNLIPSKMRITDLK